MNVTRRDLWSNFLFCFDHYLIMVEKTSLITANFGKDNGIPLSVIDILRKKVIVCAELQDG